MHTVLAAFVVYRNFALNVRTDSSVRFAFPDFQNYVKTDSMLPAKLPCGSLFVGKSQ
jgi:hypothetical protein